MYPQIGVFPFKKPAQSAYVLVYYNRSHVFTLLSFIHHMTLMVQRWCR